MSRLLNVIEERQLLGINPQDENNISEFLGCALNYSEQSTASDVRIFEVSNLRYTSARI